MHSATDTVHHSEERSLRFSVEAGRTLTIVHTLSGAGEYAVDLDVGPDASVTLIAVQHAPEGSVVTVRQTGTVGRGARLRWQNVTLGNGTVNHTLASTCAGDGATSVVDWILYAGGNERFDLSARNIFSARNGGGEISMRGVAEDRAHVRCRGMIDIGTGGGGTNTYLTQHVLMLDASAKVDAVPGLEIKTNDVKASHSATVSKVSPEDLFYFGSRGIGQNEARAMFIRGFLEEIADRIEHADARDSILDLIAAKLHRA